MKQFIPQKATYYWKISLLLFFFCYTCGAFASKIKVIDGFKYMLDTKTNEATLIAYNYSGRIDVPEKVTFEGTDYSVVAFDAECFKDCQDLVSVKIPNSVKELGDYCFNNARGLTEIVIPESITHLGEGCFLWAWDLEKVTLPSSITEICNRCFFGCNNLKSIKIPDSVTKLGESCFYQTGIEEISIPTNITTIPDNCFMGCQSLKTINIPKTVTTFGNQAFRYTGFIEFEIPSTVKSIGEGCFSDCDSLTNLIIPTSIDSLPQWCLSGCTSLNSFTIPENIKSLGSYCFQGCSSLLILKCLANTPPVTQEDTFSDLAGCILYVPKKAINSYKNKNNWNVFKAIAPLDEAAATGITTINNLKYFYDGTNFTATLLANHYSGNITVPAKITIEGKEYPVTSFANNCFSNCEDLIEISIPNTVKTLGDNCFEQCSKLNNVTIPSSITSMGDYCFMGCSSLQEITLSQNLDSLNDYCFEACGLSSIILPEGIKKLGSCCFNDCDNLKKITLPSTLTNIADNCFNGKNLREIRCNTHAVPLAKWNNPKSYNIFSTSTCILYVRKELVNDFKKDDNWKSFKYIYAFDETPTVSFQEIDGIEYFVDQVTKEASVTDLKKEDDAITIPTTIECNNEDYAVVELADLCFEAKSFYNINIPSSIKAMGWGCFEYCHNITKVTLPESINIIPNSCFNGCWHLEEVDLPSSIDSIGNWAFFSCQNLENISFPEGIKTLSHQVLTNTNVKNLTLPSSTTIVYATGLAIDNLEELTCLAAEPPVIKGKFKENGVPTENCTLYVPQESLDKYKQADDWKEFYNIQPLKSTGIKNTIAENLAYSVYDGLLTITGLKDKEKVIIYNTNGVQLASIYAQGGTVNYPLATNDIVIVKCGKQAFKIIK